MSAQQLCVECGAQAQRLIGGSCAACFARKTALLELPQVLDVELCAHCDARKVGSSWHDPDEGVPLEWIREQAVRGAARVHDKVRHPVLDLEAKAQDDKHFHYTVRLRGDVEGVPVADERRLVARQRRSVCDRCSRMFGGYYAAILQLRASGRDVRPEELKRAHKVVGDELDRQRATGNRDSFLTKSNPVPGGFDYYLGDIEGARNVARIVAHRLGATVVETAKLAGRKEGNDIYRVTFLVRIALFSDGDFAVVEKGDEAKVVQVVSLDKGKAVVLDLHTHKRDRALEEDLKRLGGPEVLVEAVVVSQTPTELQVLDPVSLRTVDVQRPAGIEVGATLWVLRHHERLYLPGRDTRPPPRQGTAAGQGGRPPEPSDLHKIKKNV